MLFQVAGVVEQDGAVGVGEFAPAGGFFLHRSDLKDAKAGVMEAEGEDFFDAGVADGCQDGAPEGAVRDDGDGFMSVLAQDFAEEDSGAPLHLRKGLAAGGKEIVGMGEFVFFGPADVFSSFSVKHAVIAFAQFFGENDFSMRPVAVDGFGGVGSAVQVAGVDDVYFGFLQSFTDQVSLFFAEFAQSAVGVPLDNPFDVFFGLAVADVIEFHGVLPIWDLFRI